MPEAEEVAPEGSELAVNELNNGVGAFGLAKENGAFGAEDDVEGLAVDPNENAVPEGCDGAMSSGISLTTTTTRRSLQKSIHPGWVVDGLPQGNLRVPPPPYRVAT